MAISPTAQLENDVVILKMFFDAYTKFDSARIAFEECKQYRGDAQNRVNRAYKELQDARKAAAIVAARVKGDAA